MSRKIEITPGFHRQSFYDGNQELVRYIHEWQNDESRFAVFDAFVKWDEGDYSYFRERTELSVDASSEEERDPTDDALDIAQKLDSLKLPSYTKPANKITESYTNYIPWDLFKQVKTQRLPRLKETKEKSTTATDAVQEPQKNYLFEIAGVFILS